MKTLLIVLALILIIGTIAIFTIGMIQPVQGGVVLLSTPSTSGRVEPTQGGSAWIPKVIVGNDNPRILELSRVLCLSLDELKKLSSDEVDQLIRQNAEKLGVMVYQNVIGPDGNETPILIDGTSVFKPETCNTPEPTTR